MQMDLAGKRALVTGSSSGIGAGIARMLAAEGARVVIHGRHEGRARGVADEIIQDGGEAAIALGDLADQAGADAVAASAAAAFGGVDILVNNVGGPVDLQAADWFDISPEVWGETFESNTVAPVRMAHAFAPAMRAAGWGRIIHISSRNATFPRPTLAAYAASKAAVNNMTISLSKALAHSGVTVNSISPGLIYTPMLDTFLRGVAIKENLGDDLDRARDYVLRHMIRQSVGRLGETEDIARMVVFLASPLNGFINGADIVIDGGAMPSG